MNDTKLRELLKTGEIHTQYLLIGSEPLLIENTVKAIKESLRVDEGFDVDIYSLSEVTVDDIMSKLYIAPFSSERRLIVVKHLEETDAATLKKLSDAISTARTKNCLVMTCTIQRGYSKTNTALKKLEQFFKNATRVTFKPDKALIHKWIMTKVKRDNLKLSPSMVAYLEEEFSNNISALKIEFDKIENYLDEAGTLNTDDVKDLAQGLCDFNKYRVVDAFLDGRTNTIRVFEDLIPFIRSHAEIVDALTRGLVFHIQKQKKILSKQTLSEVADDLVQIDRRVKRSTLFAYLMLELFFLKNSRHFRKGAVYGK